MARRTAIYEVVDRGSEDVLSTHRTRQAAVDAWRLQWHGRWVRIERRGVSTGKVVVAEGIWHEARRPD